MTVSKCEVNVRSSGGRYASSRKRLGTLPRAFQNDSKTRWTAGSTSPQRALGRRDNRLALNEGTNVGSVLEPPGRGKGRARTIVRKGARQDSWESALLRPQSRKVASIVTNVSPRLRLLLTRPTRSRSPNERDAPQENACE